MEYKKGVIHACFTDASGKYILDDDLGFAGGVLSSMEAVIEWKNLCTKIIDYLTKDYNTKNITVNIESCTTRGDNKLFITDCVFFVDRKYVGCSTLTVYNNV